MAFRRFSSVTTLRVLMLAFSLGLAAYTWSIRAFPLLIVLVLLSIYQVISLLHYVNKTNRELTRFIEAIRYNDFSQGFKDEHLGKSFSGLQGIFAEVFETLRRTRLEREEQYQYLQTVVQHVGVGVLVFSPQGDIELINSAAKTMLKTARLKNIADLRPKSPELVETLWRLPPKEKGFVKVEDAADCLYLAIQATEFKMQGSFHRLVSLQNIQRELEEKEMEAWQKLIRVLTHEIMNSITPISSLASTINQWATPSGQSGSALTGVSPEWRDDVSLAAQTIEKRSQGLLRFVDSFRSLTLVPKPKPQFFPVGDLFSRVEKLMSIHLQNNNIRYQRSIEPNNLVMEADPDLIEQVLINLLMNAVQATTGRMDGSITLGAFLNHRGRVVLQVCDNGVGVPAENLEKIFVPFFSTKEHGSGIGLSLSREIMRLHHGSIHIQSAPNSQTSFYLTF